MWDALNRFLNEIPWVETVLSWGYVPHIIAVVILVVIGYYFLRVVYRVYQAIRHGLIVPVYSKEGKKAEWVMRIRFWSQFFSMVLPPPDAEGVRLHAFNNPWRQIDSVLGKDPYLLAQYAQKNPDRFNSLLADISDIALVCDICSTHKAGRITPHSKVENGSDTDMYAQIMFLIHNLPDRQVHRLAVEIMKLLARKRQRVCPKYYGFHLRTSGRGRTALDITQDLVREMSGSE